jgi:capsular exopolysaccharide synthesis family protein
MTNNEPSSLRDLSSEYQSQSLKRDLFRYLKYWKWIALSAVLSLAVSYVYLRYTPNIYKSDAKVKILEKKESGFDITGLTGSTPLFDMTKINLSNETEIIMSRRILGRVVDELNLTTNYYNKGNLKDNILFGNEVSIVINWQFNVTDPPGGNSDQFIFKPNDNTSFNLKIVDKAFDKNFNYGELITIDEFNFIIQKNPFYTGKNLSSELYFYYQNRLRIINRLKSKIDIESVGEGSEVLELSITGENTKRNEAILNTLIQKFNEDGIEDDRQIALQTESFVTNRLELIENELDTVETNLVDFRKSSQYVDVGSETSLIYNTYSNAEQKRSDLELQKQIAEFLQDEINNNKEYSLIPANVGLANDNTNALINQFNQLVLERNKQLTSSTVNSPQVVELSEQLDLLNDNIVEAIKNYINSIEISIQNLSDREAQYNTDRQNLPEKEKRAREILRQQSVKENLYIFLLQKQVEAELSAAITAPTAKVVDYGYTSDSPVSPRPMVTYLAGLVIGLAIPIGLLYILYLFDTKVTSKEQIQAKLNLPIVAEIPLNKAYEKKIVSSTDNSDIAEAFRILRTNMSYLNVVREKGSKSKVFFSTSSTKGEGKTFNAINTASVFASNNKKTLLVGCDLRNPQLHNYLGVSRKNIGLSSYLVNNELKLEDVILRQDKVKVDFDIILSGEIPPNPSEILNNGRLEQLLEEAKTKYDYIIVDTAPTMLVTDTLTIFDLADAVIYMVRANYTELKILRHIGDLVKFKDTNNLAIAINAVEEKKGYEYNYGYGYGYYSDENKKKKKWYQFT